MNTNGIRDRRRRMAEELASQIRAEKFGQLMFQALLRGTHKRALKKRLNTIAQREGLPCIG